MLSIFLTLKSASSWHRAWAAMNSKNPGEEGEIGIFFKNILNMYHYNSYHEFLNEFLFYVSGNNDRDQQRREEQRIRRANVSTLGAPSIFQNLTDSPDNQHKFMLIL